MHNNFSLWRPKCFEKCFISLPFITLRNSVQKTSNNPISQQQATLGRATQKPLADTVTQAGPARTASIPCPIAFAGCHEQEKDSIVQDKGKEAEKYFSKAPENIQFCIWVFWCWFFFFNSSHLWMSFSLLPYQYKEQNRSSLQNIVIPGKKKEIRGTGKTGLKSKTLSVFIEKWIR